MWAVHGLVTPEEAAAAPGGREQAGVEPCKCMGRNELERETAAIRDVMSDVTREVTSEGRHMVLRRLENCKYLLQMWLWFC
jgi:hypothetical protein